eukprot:TRINITY_DN21930_c0_g1_i3.p1 TRINITY_DN21930_c0_g1~~TRINITY_DN21930_c0_g1_i3.p1  ORF type:complete len:209 (+),score=14.19 TRINITY_DN21930_c0_g1_i3:52-678(+)
MQDNSMVPPGWAREERPACKSCFCRLCRIKPNDTIIRRLMAELRQMEEKRAQTRAEYGIEIDLADPEGNDLRIWLLRIYADRVDKDCALGKELRRLCIPVMVFEVWIPDQFPVAPPKVRALKPSFNHGSFWVHQHGALCMETLTRQGWSPAMSLVQLGVQIKAMMSQGSGSISSPAATAGSSAHERDRAWGVAKRIEDSHKDWDTFRT